MGAATTALVPWRTASFLFSFLLLFHLQGIAALDETRDLLITFLSHLRLSLTALFKDRDFKMYLRTMKF